MTNTHATLDESTIAAPGGPALQAQPQPAPPLLSAPDRAQIDAQPGQRGIAGRIALVVLLLVGGSLGWHVATDLIAPGSSSGSVTALTALVAPRVSGQVQEVFVTDNQSVEAGAPMFALDLAPFDLAVRQAEANLAQVTQTVGASVISLASAEAQVRQAQSSFESTSAATQRTLDLFDRGLVAQSQVDAGTTQLAAAQAALDSAQAELESAQLRSGLNGSNPQVLGAEVQLEQARLNRSFATVVAPANGRVTNLKLAPGQYINVGAPALTFIESDSTWVVVDMRENQLANIDVGDEAQLLFDSAPGKVFRARVRGIAWGIDPGRTAANGLPQNQASSRWFEPARTIPVHIELAKGDTWPNNVRVGSKVSALVYATGRDNPVAFGASFLQYVTSYLSFFY